MPIVDRLRSVWNAFRYVEQKGLAVDYPTSTVGGTFAYSGVSPDRARLRIYNEGSILGSIYTRLSIDVAAVDFRHVLVDDQDRYENDVESDLNDCLTFEANTDQAPREFRQDIALTLFDQGICAVVPVDTTRDPNTNEVFDIQSMRVGQILQFYPSKVRVSVFNEMTMQREDVILDKRYVAIVQNPLRTIMNEPNSTLARLTRKLALLDSVDEAAGSGKLDIIIQLPYTIKSESKKLQAEQKRADLEWQLKGSQYGVAYADAADKITQLNRPTENNLLKQIEYLTDLLYVQLGLTPEIMNGTADEKTMRNYQNRTIEPIVDAIKEAMQRAFVGPAGKDKRQRIMYFSDPFKLVPITDMAEIADKLSRNEVVTPNELRGKMGFRPSKDPAADKLQNSNMPQPAEPPAGEAATAVSQNS